VSFDYGTQAALDADPDTTLVCIKEPGPVDPPEQLPCALVCNLGGGGGSDPVYAPAFITSRKIRSAPPSPPAVPDPGHAYATGVWLDQSFSAW
jgi:hypothetical protein